MTDGTLITIEGIDGSGKSTVVNGTDDVAGLKDVFSDAFFTSEPQEDHFLGRTLREALSDESMDDVALLFLFLSEHAQHIEDFIRPELSKGNLVISDRYIDSRYAYQSYAIRDCVDGDALDWIRTIQRNGWTEVPDCTIILNVDVDVGLERIADNDKEVFEKRDRLKAARDTYLSLAEEYDRYRVVDAEQDPADVIQDCIEIIESHHETAARE